MPLNAIRTLVQSDLEATDKFISAELASDIPLINELVDYVYACGGKRIRPLVVLLAARAINPEVNNCIDLAAAIELIHTATLLHDDVIDESDLRRGNKTANRIWGNNMSVLVGDFLYSRAFQLIVKLGNSEILSIFSNATNLIAEGEVLQLINCNNPDTSEESYYNVIERKTAKLFEVAAQIGTALSQYKIEQMDGMRRYGMHLGMAYQLIDDALDYNSSVEEMGKNIGNDLMEGKPTLPIIHALRKGTRTEVSLIRKAITKGSTKNLPSILSIIESTGAIHYTANAARLQAEKAIDGLTCIPDSSFRRALHDLAEFVVTRKY